MSEPEARDGGAAPQGEAAEGPEGAAPPPARPARTGRLWTLVPLAAIVLAALIQILTNIPSSSQAASPYSAETCDFLFPGPHGEFRIACQRGEELPK